MDWTGTLIGLDRQLLMVINGFSGSNGLDMLMTALSAKWVWIPVYVFLFYGLARTYGMSAMVWICAAAVGMVILTDQGSVHFFKETFERLRPCHHPDLIGQLNVVSGKCGGKFGFISSHASNVFALASFVSILMNRTSRLWSLLFVWAGLVSLSRVYLAVHYPSDIFVGALYGMMVGSSVAFLTKRALIK